MKYLAFTLTLLLLSPSLSLAVVILSEDFDDWASYQLYDPWDGIDSTTAPIQIDGVSHSPTEVTSPGRGGSGKSMKTWRNNAAFTGNDYYGSLMLEKPPVNYNSLYFRWYMRVPTEFNASAVDDQKLFRYNISNGDEIYFYLNNGDITICPNNGGADCKNVALAPKSSWQDGNWHAHQLYVNLNTRTVTYWLDGVQTYHKVGLDNMPPTSAFFGNSNDNFIQHFPLGNSFTSDRYQASWQEIDIDDLVIATTKAETDMPESPAAVGGGRLSGSLSGGGVMR